jgi:hypothetical protein
MNTETLNRISATKGFSGDIGHDDRIAVIESATHATLDGHRAKISGYTRDFAQVWTLPKKGKGPSYMIEFAWQSVARILLKGGCFNS